jgi:hypothetical protein
MAMALVDELASFDIVVEMWDSGKIGGKRGGFKGKHGAAKLKLYESKGGHIQHMGCRSKRGELNPGYQVAGMPNAAQAALLQRPTAALSKLVVADKGGKR